MSTSKNNESSQAAELAVRSGADAIVETLQQSGVERVFGYSGGGTMVLINSIVSHQLPNMCGRTELSGAWMSYGYNRVKGRLASACLFHCVGALHASPVVYAAKLDSTPFFMMDVNLDSALDMREGLQEAIDVYPALKPLSKYIRKVVTAEDLPLAVRQSVISASTGRPGPSVLDLAFQVLSGPTTCKTEPLKLPAPPAASETALQGAVDLIRNAKQPVLFVGAGVHLSKAAAELVELAESTGIPIISSSWGGRGIVPDDHPLFAGVMGSFGWRCANDLAQHSDLWIAVGTTFSQMTTGAWNLEKPEQVIHIDIDPNEIGKIFQPTVGIVADAKVALRQLKEALDKKGFTAASRNTQALMDQVKSAKGEWFKFHNTLAEHRGELINQYFLIQKMGEELPAGSIVVGDSGGHAFMFYRSFNYRKYTPMAVGSRYMSLGASLPIAMGAKLAEPERVVVSYHGDGGLYYDFMELSTLAQHKIKVIIIVDNNRCLLANRSGMRIMGYENPWAEVPETTDFVALAKSLGVEGEQVKRPDDIAAAIQRALKAEGSYLIDVLTDPETRIKRAISNVIPIISDRKPEQGANRHISPPLKGSWPN
jgi:acetolactate synthase-1/2/3 large subunit